MPAGFLMGGDTNIHNKWVDFYSARFKNESSEAFPVSSPKLTKKTRKLAGLLKLQPVQADEESDE